MWQIWLILSGVFLIIEIATTGFLVFWLSIASLISMVVSFFIPSVEFQTAVFVIASTILIFATRPFANKFDTKKAVPTNVYTLNGKKAIVVEEINTTDGKGLIKVNGETWSAFCDEDVTIAKDSEVEIIKIEGVKAYVKPLTVTSTK